LRNSSFAGTTWSSSKPDALSAKYSRNACFQPTTSARAAKRCSVRTMSSSASFWANAVNNDTATMAVVSRAPRRARSRAGVETQFM
jgi:hypothetical protein